MANAVKWSSLASAASFWTSTELNSLANNTLSAASAAYDNATNKNMFADFEIILGSWTPTTGGYISLYINPAPDGTNYTDVKRESSQSLLGVWSLDTAAAARRLVLRGIQLPPYTVKFYIDNQSGASLNASGNSMKLWAYNPEIQ